MDVSVSGGSFIGKVDFNKAIGSISDGLAHLIDFPQRLDSYTS